jgi:hypothetical protein
MLDKNGMLLQVPKEENKLNEDVSEGATTYAETGDHNMSRNFNSFRSYHPVGNKKLK